MGKATPKPKAEDVRVRNAIEHAVTSALDKFKAGDWEALFGTVEAEERQEDLQEEEAEAADRARGRDEDEEVGRPTAASKREGREREPKGPPVPVSAEELEEKEEQLANALIDLLYDYPNGLLLSQLKPALQRGGFALHLEMLGCSKLSEVFTRSERFERLCVLRHVEARNEIFVALSDEFRPPPKETSDAKLSSPKKAAGKRIATAKRGVSKRVELVTQ